MARFEDFKIGDRVRFGLNERGNPYWNSHRQLGKFTGKFGQGTVSEIDEPDGVCVAIDPGYKNSEWWFSFEGEQSNHPAHLQLIKTAVAKKESTCRCDITKLMNTGHEVGCPHYVKRKRYSYC